MKKNYIFYCLVVLFSYGFSQTTLVTVDRDNIVGTTMTGNEASISSIGFTRGPGIDINTNAINYTSANWDATTLPEAIANDEYIQWSTSAMASNNMTITTLDMRARRADNGPQNFQVYYSLDGFATTSVAIGGEQLTPTDASSFSFSGLNITSGVGGTITFRVYAYNATNPGSWFRIPGKVDWVAYGITKPGVRLIGTLTPEVFTFNGTWSPYDPTGVSTASDDIIIETGDVTISGDVIANTVTVDPGASLTIDTGVTLTTNTVTLESTSTAFSSLIADGTISGTVVYERFVNTLSTGIGGNDLISLPLMPNGLTFDTFITHGDNATEIADNGTYYAFAPYNNLTAEAYENFTMTSTDMLLKAKGYRVATDAGDLLTFTGTPDNGTVSYPISSPVIGNKWNLIGNPYPSFVDADLFLNTANSALLDPSAVAIYAYNSGVYTGEAGTTSDFTIINKATIAALTGENLNIAPGQGFFVASNTLGGAIEFTPAMRTVSGDDDYITGRTSNESNFFKLYLTGSETYSTSIFFNTNASLGLDPGYDAVVYGENSENYPLFSHLVEENTGKSMAIQAIDDTNLTSISIPLGVNANQGEAVTFSVDTANLSSSTQVYLEDTVANTFTLLNLGDYTLTPNTDLSGTGRFYLRVSNATLSIIDNNFDQLHIYSNLNEKTIVIAGELVESTKATLYDIQGRVVNTTVLTNTETSQSIDVKHLNAGVYVIQLNNGSQNKTQKIVIR